ncbi:hypothetical protein MtrunA17_Chr4g0011131 [Medicago truncatula]|uniref:Transmembrane protein n=1 Tax=Medicago truncatula TaxID=3880 RepID=A0A396I368_MEDTR|nr:hypothetical protein MtrunA17_Chr4g0011131 [Medicago truncatula]
MAFPISHLFTLTLTPAVGFPPGSDPSAPITVITTKLFPLENENVLQLENEKIEFFYFDQLYDGSYEFRNLMNKFNLSILPLCLEILLFFVGLYLSLFLTDSSLLLEILFFAFLHIL